MFYAIIGPDGVVVSTCYSPGAAPRIAGHDAVGIKGEGAGLIGQSYRDGSFSDMAAFTNMEEARSSLWAEAKEIRDARMTAGLIFQDATYDTDDRSQAMIGHAVRAALAARITDQPFERLWTTADDKEVSLDREAVIELGQALEAHLDACHRAARAIRAKIAAAADPEALAAVNIRAGYAGG